MARRGFVITELDKLKIRLAAMTRNERDQVGDIIRYLNTLDGKAQSQEQEPGQGQGATTKRRGRQAGTRAGAGVAKPVRRKVVRRKRKTGATEATAGAVSIVPDLSPEVDASAAEYRIVN